MPAQGFLGNGLSVRVRTTNPGRHRNDDDDDDEGAVVNLNLVSAIGNAVQT